MYTNNQTISVESRQLSQFRNQFRFTVHRNKYIVLTMCSVESLAIFSQSKTMEKAFSLPVVSDTYTYGKTLSTVKILYSEYDCN